MFDDPDAMVEWQSNLISHERFSESISRQKVRNAGITQELTVTLLEEEPPTMTKSRYEGAQVPLEVTNTFTAVSDDSTEWLAVMDLKLSLLTKALGPVLKPVMLELIKRNGRDFKEYVEARAS